MVALDELITLPLLPQIIEFFMLIAPSLEIPPYEFPAELAAIVLFMIVRFPPVSFFIPPPNNPALLPEKRQLINDELE